MGSNGKVADEVADDRQGLLWSPASFAQRRGGPLLGRYFRLLQQMRAHKGLQCNEAPL